MALGFHFDLSAAANIIILISAVIIAAKNIYAFLKKPVDDIKDKAQSAEEKHIEEVLKREVPGILEKNYEVILNSLNDLKGMSAEQESQLIAIKESVDLLNASQLDILRYNMNAIYYKYRPYKKILDCDKKAFLKLYSDYHSAGGNTWIDSLYKEVVTWETVEFESELKT